MARQATVVGLMADPGLSRKAAQTAADDLEQDLARHSDGSMEWKVDVSEESLSLTPDGIVPVMDEAQGVRSRYGWDYVLYLTDLPRYHDKEPLLCEVSSINHAALVSVTAMGAFRLQNKIRKLLVALIHAVQEGADNYPLVDTIQTTAGFKAARQASRPGREDTAYIGLSGWSSRLKLLGGMVRSNKPGSMLPALSGSITVAVASGAFGIYYSSIWALADPLHPVRLVLIGVVVIAMLSFWLIFRNGLWNKRKKVASPWQWWLDNITTIIMVTTSVALMFLLLAAGLFGLALAVIHVDYLQSQLMHPVSLFDYAKLSWMAATLGMLTGALGSNFNSDEKVRAATYSNREYQRRERQDSYDD